MDLVAHGSIGGAELRTVALMAALDGAFAIAAGSIDGLTLDASASTDDEPVDVPLPVADGVDLHDLLWETVRRLDGLDALPVLLSPFRERVAPAADIGKEDSELTARQRDVLVHANGRRNARDIAFAVGRGVYPVMVEISYLLASGVLEIAPATSKMTLPTRLESLRPRHAAAEEDLPPPREAGIYETEGKHSGL